MKITDVNAIWLRYPIPEDRQHVSDFGRLTTFDMTLVEVVTDGGITGYGEAKTQVGSSSDNHAVVAMIQHEFRPLLVGKDPRRITALWEDMYNGVRAHYALSRGRGFPVLGRRGLTISAISGIDMALWDILGKSLEAPVYQLLGGKCRDELPAYASGGWADADGIGAQLQGYIAQGGFKAVKMRVGSMDGDVDTSAARVKAAREALGPDIAIMVDAHGTFSVREAQRFARKVKECDLAWFEEPVNADDKAGCAEVRASTDIPIACGESEFTRFAFRDLITMRAADILQPDLAIMGGITEAVRVAALAGAHQLIVAPHLWGSALLFAAGLQLAAAIPNCTILEYSLGFNPMLRQLADTPPEVSGGRIVIPDRPGLGVTINDRFVERYRIR
ncbi:MAG: mandelate racemase/muconate lactonizing enzyme family protein [Deltaproteobacteria bacterium]|nr:mandelate racemase/muconate lactonizing enzyme family protein [Deltaproteobacteria bacterium]MBW1960177.1 mandelate racemase/muconate lactonizing enzyme family protein [Deltaproteobacteria bacterium]MBW1993693.1 mandelate racemase/muconate lactonizing enzyme family protein [Deltaproteobacteria bacterium]MBW2152020.1 mandelate racemase/muconate lactonizing enzyme family protein [Deltaproteobacteria bacterium]